MNIDQASKLTTNLLTSLSVIGLMLLTAYPSYADLLQSSGKINFLRVHQVGSKYGPATDQIDVEVVIKLAGQTGKAFGFQLRNDSNFLAHQGMLDLLRDAFNQDHRVNIDYRIDPGKNNGTIIRVWLTR